MGDMTARLACRRDCHIKLVNGWRNRASTEIVNRKARYSLIVSLRGPSEEVDLYTPISTLVAVPLSVETEI